MPGLWGQMLMRSQAPQSTRRFTASPLSTPGSSDVPPDIVTRVSAQNREVVRWLLDGARLILAHEHRHIEPARRVMHTPGFA